MRNIKLFSAVMIFVTAINFISCSEVEPIDPAIVIPIDTPNPDCDKPISFQASDFINNTNVNLSWVASGDETAWQIEYGISGFAIGTGTTALANTTNYTVANLVSTTNYQFYVRAVCSEGSFSDWTGPIAVGTTSTSCNAPGNVVAVRNATDATKVDVSWTAGGTETGWQVQYGTAGFAIGTGTTVQSSATTKQLTGLLTNQAYQIYVRAACSATDSSTWVGPINITSNVVVNYGFMNANVNGTQYNGLKPFFYPFSGAEADLEMSSENGKFLRIQGHSDPLTNPSENFVEITIDIHESLWVPGTSVLQSDLTEGPNANVNLIIVNSTNGWTTTEMEVPGTITITEFNSVTKRVQGTFSFTYNLTGDTTGGPYPVTNGTFDFPIADEVFE